MKMKKKKSYYLIVQRNILIKVEVSKPLTDQFNFIVDVFPQTNKKPAKQIKFDI